jgi:hypothetical protein
MFRGSILLASHAKPQAAVTVVQSIRRTVTIAGFPLSAFNELDHLLSHQGNI